MKLLKNGDGVGQSQRAGEEMKWEYKNFSVEDGKRFDFTQLGNDGWEMVGFAYVPPRERSTFLGRFSDGGFTLFYFKRPKE
jgi:hypothetical protein